MALRPEAKAIIEKFSMNLDQGASTLFPVYRSKCGSHDLVISGPGKVNAAAATGYLAGLAGDDGATRGWLNFGIAGSGGNDFGEVFLASKISDSATGRSHFPPCLWDRKLTPKRKAVSTVEQPCEIYPEDDVLVEMEASGFYATAIKCQTMELCQSIKVVSDDPAHSISAITKESVSTMCANALVTIEPWLDAYSDSIKAVNSVNSDPPAMAALLAGLHFSATREHQLRRLVQLWRAKFDDNLPELDPNSYPDAKSCIESIREQLWAENKIHTKLA
ncbi:MAG: hypothetical protein P1U86_03100 [Verrucomicrobiales bacterium]|nr:hypothetical protein [Verrucomicrobiales bacterium]